MWLRFCMASLPCAASCNSSCRPGSMRACSCHVRFLCLRSAALVVLCCTGRIPGLTTADFQPGTQQVQVLDSKACSNWSTQAGRGRVFFLAHKPDCKLWEAQFAAFHVQLSCSTLHIHKSSSLKPAVTFEIKFYFWQSISCCQGVTLEPLASFLEPVWNQFNVLPMRMWLSTSVEAGPYYRDRMRALGNIVVPQTGALGMNLLQRLRKASTA